MKEDVAETQLSVLVVEDEEADFDFIQGAISQIGVQIHAAESAENAIEILSKCRVDLVLCDYVLPGKNGLELLKYLREKIGMVRYVLMTGYANVELVIQALRHGANDFLIKPFGTEEIRDVVIRTTRDHIELSTPSAIKIPDHVMEDGLWGASPKFINCLSLALKLTQSDAPVLISGEKGTGKKMFAKFIHKQSDRFPNPFIEMDCRESIDNLFDEEKLNRISRATVFFNEVGALTLSGQAKLLRFLQDQVFGGLGPGHWSRTEIRVIASTSRDLREAVLAGHFRDALWFCLSAAALNIPPLRNRDGDVIVLAQKFLDRFNTHYGKSLTLTLENERVLRNHNWPGNIQELARVMERAVVLSDGLKLAFEFDQVENCKPSGLYFVEDSVHMRRRAAEREAILEALYACRWKKTQAAEWLKISRRTLLYKIKEYGIKPLKITKRDSR